MEAMEVGCWIGSVVIGSCKAERRTRAEDIPRTQWVSNFPAEANVTHAAFALVRGVSVFIFIFRNIIVREV